MVGSYMFRGRGSKWVMVLHLVGVAAFSASLPREITTSGHCAELAVKGDVAFRKANFAAAESAYREAFSRDRTCARGAWGLGRIEELNFRRGSARDYFAAAFRLDPRDPQIIRSYASVITDRAAEAILLRNYITLGGDGRRGLESAAGHIQLDQRLGARDVNTLMTPYQPYTLLMSPSYPGSARPAGMVLRVSINGGKPLRLIFDTGARGVLIRSKAAEKLGLEFLGDSLVGGIGRSEPAKSWIGLAQSLRIGDLQMRNCPIEVSDGLPSTDADGVIGAAMFQRFLIRFNPGEKILELLPFAEARAFTPERPWHGHDRTLEPGMESFTKAHQIGHLLLVRAKVNRDTFGYFLLDTGAAFSSLSSELAGMSALNANAVPVAGLSGRAAGAVRLSPVQFQIAQEPIVDVEPIAIDLREMSRREGVEISGLIGYPAVSQAILTINYRDGLIDIQRGAAPRAAAGPRPATRP
jgi:predicted aspartyl protease